MSQSFTIHKRLKTLCSKRESAKNTREYSAGFFNSQGIGMEFGMKKEKYEYSEGMRLPSEDEIQEIDREEGYKYLGLLDADGVKDA